MKRFLSLVLALIFVFSFAACGASVEDNTDRGVVIVYLDGKSISEITVANFQKKTTDTTIGEDAYYGKALSDIVGDVVDMETVNAAFTKSADGYAQYFADAKDLFIATYKVDGETHESIVDDEGNDCFTAVTASAKAKVVTEIYLLSDAQDWEVKVDMNGETKTIGIADFMAMKPEYKTLNHIYNGGSDTFEGEYLCVDSKTFWEAMGQELVSVTNDDGSTVYYVDGMDLSITGYVQASGSSLELKVNKDLKANPLKEKTAWNVYYYVLINGDDYHEVEGSQGADIGLSCIFSGTGIRWMTTPITEIAFAPAEAE